jgi:hypothetical protein
MRQAGAGKGQEESSFFWKKKKQKKLCSFKAGSPDQRTPSEKSFFASFFPKKEDSSFLPLAFPGPR